MASLCGAALRAEAASPGHDQSGPLGWRLLAGAPDAAVAPVAPDG